VVSDMIKRRSKNMDEGFKKTKQED